MLSSTLWNINKRRYKAIWSPVLDSVWLNVFLSLRWICLLESWCLTSSCLETASQTSLKSSVLGKLPALHTHTYTQTHTHVHPRTFAALVTFSLLSDKLRSTKYSWQLTRNAFEGLSTYTYLYICAFSKNYPKKGKRNRKNMIQFGNKMTRHLPCFVALCNVFYFALTYATHLVLCAWSDIAE